MPIGAMALEAEVRGIDLQHEAAFHDGLVFVRKRSAERLEMGFPRGVVLVRRNRRHDAGGGGGEKCLGETPTIPSERSDEVGAFGLERGVAYIGDLADRLRDEFAVAHR